MFRNKISPYLGRTLRGIVEKTFLRGRLVWDISSGKQPYPSHGEVM